MRFVAQSSLLLALAACTSDGVAGPLDQTPALVVAPVAEVVEVVAPLYRIDMRVVGRSPRSFTYGDCRGRALDRRTMSGWQQTTATNLFGGCALVLHVISGVGSGSDIPVLLGHRPEPGVYRIRMEFDHRHGTVVATSNTFVIE